MEAGRVDTKRRWVWVVAALVLVLLLVLTPPLVNVNRLRRRIVVTMSASLGRPVHLDNVTLNVLPVPGFTLENLVVNEDPAFGDEPVIQANSVRVTLRVSSLWRRHVEFGTVRFTDPSVNLVRRADGRWNLESILLHAAQTEAAPTAQTKASEAPRFPYIEATGARVNVKNGVEKLPFALTEADFALWLPSPQQWKFRMDAKPVRTDVTVSDTGAVHVEATLERAAHVADVPITMEARWTGAPLGEASRMFNGADAGWRGSVDVSASLHGTLGAADVNTTTTLRGLRRADFVPARVLDLDVRCEGSLATVTAIVTKPQCNLSKAPERLLNLGETTVPSATLLAWSAAELNLTGLKTQGAAVMSPGLPVDWVLDVARLFSQRVPVEERPAGTIVANFMAGEGGWTGSAQGSLPMGEGSPSYFTVLAGGQELTLVPVPVMLAGKASGLTLGATVNRGGYELRVSGAATPAQMAAVRALAPPLADGLDAVVPAAADDADAVLPVHVTCRRSWSQAQVCEAVAVPVVKSVGRKRRR